MTTSGALRVAKRNTNPYTQKNVYTQTPNRRPPAWGSYSYSYYYDYQCKFGGRSGRGALEWRSGTLKLFSV